MKKIIILLCLPLFLFSCKAKSPKRKVYIDKNSKIKTDSPVDTAYVEDKNGNLRMILIEKIQKIEGDWKLKSINSLDYSKTFEMASLSIKSSKGKKTISGSDGCNSFGGAIVGLTNDKIKFSNIFSTEMYCEDIAKMTNAFNKALQQTAGYSMKENILILKNDKGEPLLKFGRE